MPLTEQEAAELAQIESELKRRSTDLSPRDAAELAAIDAELGSRSGGVGQAALSGFGQGATLGYLPQLQAGVEQGVDYLTSFIPGSASNVDEQLRDQGFGVPEQTYVESRDKFAQDIQTQQQQNPGAFTAGQIGGALASGIATGGSGTAAASTLGKVAQAAKTGGAYGFLQNPGDTEGELSPLQIQERIKNASIGAVTGAAAQGAMSGVGALATKIKEIPTNLKTFSELRALKGSGAMLKDFRKAFGNKKASELGREILDSGILAAGDDVTDIAKKAVIAKQAAGEVIGEVYSSTDDILMRLDPKNLSPRQIDKLSKSQINLDAFGSNYKNQLKNKLRGKAGGEEIYNKLAKTLDELSQNGKDVPLSKVREIRSSVDDLINFSKANAELSGVQKEYLALRNKLQDLAKERVAVVDSIRGTQNLSKLNEFNKKFSNMAEIAKIAEDKAAREQSNAAFGLRERISGGVGATVGGMVGGIPGAIIGGSLGSITTKAARQYGTPLVARMADRTARVLEKNPNLLGEFAQPLIEAASSNPETFVNIITRLRVDPEFKKKLNKASK